MNRLPVEIVVEILSIGMDVHPVPSDILRVCRTWHKTMAPLLRTNIRLNSLSQLYYFGKTARISNVPQTFYLYLPGGAVHFIGRSQPTEFGITADCEYTKDSLQIRTKVVDSGGVWGCLRAALQKCPDIQHVTLRLHSFVSDPDLKLLPTALSIINPRFFQWKGPDPDHHISTAIVPRATEYLFKAMKSWTNLRKLMLGNIQFPSPPTSSVLMTTFTFQSHSSLREIHIAQAVFLPPGSVAAMVMMVPSLQSLILEDAYESSIWGPRVRDTTIMEELRHIKDEDPRKLRLKEVVKCTIRLERIIGGDRG